MFNFSFFVLFQRESFKSGYGTLEISDAEAISSIYRGHDSMTKVLSHRKKYLISVIRIWRSEGPIVRFLL